MLLREQSQIRLTRSQIQQGPPDDEEHARDLLVGVGRTFRTTGTIEGMGLSENIKRGQLLNLEAVKGEMLEALPGHLGDDGSGQHDLTGLVNLFPQVGQLVHEFERSARHDDPDLLRRLQDAQVALDQVKRDLGAPESLSEPTRLYLDLFTRELQTMLETCHEAGGSSLGAKSVSNQTMTGLRDAPVDESMQEAMDRIDGSTFDREHKDQAKQILTLAGQIMARSKEPNLPMGDRLRMTGELDSLSQEFSRILTDQNRDIDGTGQRLIHELRDLDFEMDTGVVSTFQFDGEPVPGELAREFGTAMKAVGIALETSDRGLRLDEDDIRELTGHINTLGRFIVEYKGPLSTPLFDELARLQAYVEQARG
jgi:hypothetical protein